MIPRLFDVGNNVMGIYTTLQIPVAAIGAFILIPLLLKGHWCGLLLGLLYWTMGNVTNPLWFIVPFQYQVSVGRSGRARRNPTHCNQIVFWKMLGFTSFYPTG
jgi:hypothetical protein